MINFQFVKERHIIINTLEKTGSNLLTNILSDITSIKEITLGDGSIDNYSFSIAAAYSNREKKLISKTHSLPNVSFMEYLSNNQIRPIILKRDEQEILSSYHAHVLRGKTFSSELVKSMSEHDQVEFISQRHCFRIIQFKIQWILALQKFRIEPIIIDMQQILGPSGASLIQDLLNNLNFKQEYDHGAIRATIDSVSKSPRSNHYGTKKIYQYHSAFAYKYKQAFFIKYPELGQFYNLF